MVGGRLPSFRVFLKSLTLKGFKSFADATTLEFRPGLTVVVGPNGSGKSNVVDAVAWVLGAQGPRTLRSSRMEDVIFAGSASRPALGRAEVSLTIDNSARLLPVDLIEVTVTRTLFRSDDSEYAINGAPCRLLDVQELLSDAGVGRHQHVIVSQGHLDAVLDSRPEGRRTLIEEAAGVHKYRRRREKAQRRLDATQDDVVRLQDLLREVRRQLRSLERQAAAARRHRELEEERRALRLHAAGRELDELREGLESAARTRAELAVAQSAAAEEMRRLQAESAAVEARASQPHDDADDLLVRFERLRGRARGVAALLAERQRAVHGQLELDLDERLRSLQSEQATLASELATVEADAGALGPELDQLAAAEAALAADRASFEEQWHEGASAASGRAAEVRGELSALHAGLARSRSELDRLEGRRAGIVRHQVQLADQLANLRSELDDAERAAAAVADRAARADAARAESQAALEQAEAELQGADGCRRTWEGRAEALASVVEHDRANADRLAASEGALGTLSGLVDVDEGWEAAFEAAVGEASSAVVVEDADAARRALGQARHQGLGATILPLGETARTTADGGRSRESELRLHVQPRSEALGHLLDALLGPVVVVSDWEEGVALVVAHPGLVAVTADGDRFSHGGWRVGASALPTRAALEEARSRAAEAGASLALARERLRSARSKLESASAEADQVADQQLAHRARLGQLREAMERVGSEQRSLASEREGVEADLEAQAGRVTAEQSRIADLEATLPALSVEEAAGAERGLARQAAWRGLHERLAAVSALRTDLEVRAAALEERRTLLSRRLEEVAARLHALDAERATAARRRSQLETAATMAGRLAVLVAERLAWVDSRLDELHEQRRRRQATLRECSGRLEELRREQATAGQELDDLRERARQLELDETGLRLRAEATSERVLRELGCEPETAVVAPCPELPPGVSPGQRLQELDHELGALGPVNALALEDHDALEERHRFLEGQLDDVRSARQELTKVIRAIDSEITEVFAAAFADVSENFAKLFSSLFPGGGAQLRLTDPDDLSNTGIEVEARPSGKRVGKLSLLSGGERSLTALAFLFAVFRSRPSPFYLLDEVEAALDDVNLNRFLELVNEFRDEAQLVVVSHQKRTMEAADCLYGVTMQPGGSSRVVTERAREVPNGA